LASVTLPASAEVMACGCPQVATPARRRGNGPVLRSSRANWARTKVFFWHRNINPLCQACNQRSLQSQERPGAPLLSARRKRRCGNGKRRRQRPTAKGPAPTCSEPKTTRRKRSKRTLQGSGGRRNDPQRAGSDSLCASARHCASYSNVSRLSRYCSRLLAKRSGSPAMICF
jgi:hypothetical protein